MLFQCFAWPWLQKLLALAFAATSFMLIWSEATIGSGRDPDLSPFSHVRHQTPPLHLHIPPSCPTPKNQQPSLDNE